MITTQTVSHPAQPATAFAPADLVARMADILVEGGPNGLITDKEMARRLGVSLEKVQASADAASAIASNRLERQVS